MAIDRGAGQVMTATVDRLAAFRWSALRRPAVHARESDGLRPPARIGAPGQESFDGGAVKPARLLQRRAEFGDRPPPVLSPGRAAVVECRLRRRRDVGEAKPVEQPGQPAADEEVNARLARPGEPAIPEPAYRRR